MSPRKLNFRVSFTCWWQKKAKVSPLVLWAPISVSFQKPISLPHWQPWTEGDCSSTLAFSILFGQKLSFVLGETLAQNITSTRFITFCSAPGKGGGMAQRCKESWHLTRETLYSGMLSQCPLGNSDPSVSDLIPTPQPSSISWNFEFNESLHLGNRRQGGKSPETLENFYHVVYQNSGHQTFWK